MPGQLQVRQGSIVSGGSHDYANGVSEGVMCIRWGRWADVENPGWLWGYVLPHSPMVYEFRTAPELPDPDVPF